jgi:hypothetical protein
MPIYQFTSSEPNPPFAKMRMASYDDYCYDCDCEGIQPIDWVTFKMLVGELLHKHKGQEAWACMYAQKVAFDRYHENGM